MPNRDILARQYILSLKTSLYVPLWKRDGTEFISDDAQGYLCTVTGALWTPRGRSFDGVDDKVSIADSRALDVGTGNFTILGWANPTLSAGMNFIDKVVAGTGQGWSFMVSFRLLWSRIRADASNYAILSGSALLPLKTWSFVAVQRTRTTLQGFINGALDTGQSQTNLGTGGATNPDTTQPVRLGLKGDDTGDFTGTIGEVLLFRRALTVAEIQRIYLVTKWRYSG